MVRSFLVTVSEKLKQIHSCIIQYGVCYTIPKINADKSQKSRYSFTEADNTLIKYCVESYKKEGQHPN